VIEPKKTAMIVVDMQNDFVIRDKTRDTHCISLGNRWSDFLIPNQILGR